MYQWNAENNKFEFLPPPKTTQPPPRTRPLFPEVAQNKFTTGSDQSPSETLNFYQNRNKIEFEKFKIGKIKLILAIQVHSRSEFLKILLDSIQSAFENYKQKE